MRGPFSAVITILFIKSFEQQSLTTLSYKSKDLEMLR